MQPQKFQTNNNPFYDDISSYDNRPNFAQKREPEQPNGQSSGTGYKTVLVVILLLLISKFLGNMFFLMNVFGVNTYRDEVLTLMIAGISLLWSLILLIITIALLCMNSEMP